MAGPTQLIQIELAPPLRVPKPEWLRAKAPVGDNFHNLKKLARGLGLHTVCESAQCPNIGECWRSEERRVGKEWRSRGAPRHGKEKEEVTIGRDKREGGGRRR